MASDEEDACEDLVVEVWPDEYFDEAVLNPTQLSDLPLDLLMMIVGPLDLRDRFHAMLTSHAMLEAVVKSTCTNLGNGRLVLTPVEENGRVIRISFGGLQPIKSCHEESMELFAKLRCLFKKVHLEELKINSVDLESEQLVELNEFIDDVVFFDKLSIERRGPLSQRTKELIYKAKKEVEIKIPNDMLSDVVIDNRNNMSEEEMLEIERPVRFNFARNTILSEELFMKLIRRGHSLIHCETELRSAESLAKVIELVSASPVHQKVAFSNTDIDMCMSYVHSVQAMKKEQELDCFRGICSEEKFVHLGATIVIWGAAMYARRRKAKIVVKSKNCPNEGSDDFLNFLF